jgi:hypothetical protein
VAVGVVRESIDVLYDTFFLVVGLLDEEAVVLDGGRLLLGMGRQKGKGGEQGESGKQDEAHELGTFHFEYEIEFHFHM